MGVLRPPIKPRESAIIPPEAVRIPTFQRQLERGTPLIFRTYKDVANLLPQQERSAFEKMVLDDIRKKQALEIIQADPSDRQLVSKREAEFYLKDKKEPPQIRINHVEAAIFESLMSRLISANWLPGWKLIETSTYDDIVNRVDALFSNGQTMVAIDYTCQTSKEKIREKVESILKKIEQGELGTVKYYAGDTKGALKNLPLIILGIEAASLNELLKLYLDNSPEARQKIAAHHIKYELVEEMLAQCKYFKEAIERAHPNASDPRSKAHAIWRQYDVLEKEFLLFRARVIEELKSEHPREIKRILAMPDYKNKNEEEAMAIFLDMIKKESLAKDLTFQLLMRRLEAAA